MIALSVGGVAVYSLALLVLIEAAAAAQAIQKRVIVCVSTLLWQHWIVQRSFVKLVTSDDCIT